MEMGFCGRRRGGGMWWLARRKTRRSHCWGRYWRSFAGPDPALVPAPAIQWEEMRLMLGGSGVVGVGGASAR